MRPTIILKRRVSGASEKAIQRFAARACNAAGLRGCITVLVTGNREIQALNARFRRKKYATDVLSFPPPVFSESFAGDIAISLDIAARNARALGHSVSDEIRILILHGILHLAGYDHEGDKGEMTQKELTLRKKLALPAGLIERSSSKRTAKQRAPARFRV
jgi:probable rRNA maturation factor